MHKLFLYTAPSLWMAVTQLSLDITRSCINPYRYVAIFSIALTISLNAMYILHTLNSTEVSILINKTRNIIGIYS